MKKSPWLVTATLGLAFALPAVSGELFVSTTEYLTEKKDPTDLKVYVDKEKVRVDGMNIRSKADEGQSYMIFRGDKDLFWSVNDKEKTYTEMTKHDMERVATQMESAMKQMNEQMAKMSPEQRAAMEKMMKGFQGAQSAIAGKTTYNKLGSDKVNGWSCEKYEALRDGVKRSEFCLADPKKLDVDPADFQALKGMSDFFMKMAKEMASVMPGLSSQEGPQGIPVRIVAFEDGVAKTKTEVKQVKHESPAASLFDVPAGYAKKSNGLDRHAENGNQ